METKVISESTKKKRMVNGDLSRTKQVVYITKIGKNKKGKPIYSSRTKHEKI